MMLSLQARLLLSVSVILLTLLTAVTVISYDKGVHEVEEFLNGQLALSHRLIDAQVQNTMKSSVLPRMSNSQDRTLIEMIANDDRSEYEPELAFKVWNMSGSVVLQSSNAIDMPKLQIGREQEVNFDGRSWLIRNHLSSTGMYVIQTAHPLGTRALVGLDVMWRVISPLLIGIPIGLFLLYVAIRRTFRPIQQLSNQIADRDVFDTTPIILTDVIKELKPLISSFNQLLTRITKSYKSEREFTANAAHELRSPIAGIKIQAQVAEVSTDPIVKRNALRQVLLGIKRCERLISQMLRLAKLDPDHPDTLKLERVAASEIALDAIEVVASEVRDREQRILFDDRTQNLMINADSDLLSTALSNLLENASKYSPSHTVIQLVLAQRGEQVRFEIRDEGPGLPPDDLDRLKQRFARGSDTAGQTGAGLGLSIVEKIVKLHRGKLTLSSEVGQGLSVVICVDGRA